jgi:RHS repeat-associated protein
VKSTVNGATTIYIGNYYEWTGSASSMVKYYYIGAQRVARRYGTSILTYFLVDHLGSTSVALNTAGTVLGRRDYKAWGEMRYSTGSVNTTYLYTGQKDEPSFGLTSQDGLYFYSSRWYDPTLGRFLQADSVVPGAGNPQAWDRYTYVFNNPISNNDPTGHFVNPGTAVYDSDGDSSIGAFVNVDLASSIPQNQLKPEPAQYIWSGGILLSNQCGHFATEMIYETITHKVKTYPEIYGFLPQDGSTVEQLAGLMRKLLPNGWASTVYSNQGAWTYLKGGYAKAQIMSDYWYNRNGSNQMREVLCEILQKGHYIIIGTLLNTANGRQDSTGAKHWVVVTGIVGNYVRINDPFDNREEWYLWSDFQASVMADGSVALEVFNFINQPEPIINGMK